MPFTLAHPVAILPLVRPLGRFAVASALVVGSVAPDLAYFVPLPISREQTHSLPGLLWFCLPFGLLTYFVFHLLFAPLIHGLSPKQIATRLPEQWSGTSVQNPISIPVVISILVGALTHVLWDSFTHSGGLPSTVLPLLDRQVGEVGGYTIYVHKVLQHTSNFLGMGILAWWLWRAYRSENPQGSEPALSPLAQIAILGAILVPPVVVSLFAAARFLEEPLGFVAKLQHMVGAAVFTGGPILMATVSLAAVALALLTRGKAEKLN